MKTRPILFSGAMVRALLAGTKTQTRRVMKPQPVWVAEPNVPFATVDADPKGIIACPYGQPGDRLWVRENFSGPHCMDAAHGCAAVPPGKWGVSSNIWYWADGNPEFGDWTKPRPSIHMPRWASRITLEIVSVRVERLQDISEADALDEGVTYNDIPNNGLDPMRARTWYRGLWESINGPGSWDANPFVWVVEFKRVTA
jgi:hypothetical protein